MAVYSLYIAIIFLYDITMHTAIDIHTNIIVWKSQNSHLKIDINFTSFLAGYSESKTPSYVYMVGVLY